MLDTLTDMFMKSALVLGIGFALIIRLSTKHPKASGGIARGILSMLFRK
jgi:Na+-transporting NADH:ubiquinone oxidoreductase subunit NqrB